MRAKPALVCAAVPATEMAGLIGAGMGADRAIALQASAPSPWGEFHDLRWLLVVPSSWAALAAGLVGAILLRSLLTAWVVHESWPVDRLLRPSLRKQFTHQLAFTAAAYLLLFPWAALDFGVSVVAISWLFIAFLPAVVLLALASPHGHLPRSWWREAPSLRCVAWIALVFCAYTAGGAALHAAPEGSWIPLAAIGGLFNAVAWERIVAASLGAARRRRIPVAPATAFGMLAVAVVGTVIGFAVHGSAPIPRSAQASSGSSGSGPPVLIVGGFDSTMAGAAPHPIPGPYDESRFSYRGLGPDGVPLAYTAADTHRSISILAQLMAEQVAAIHQRTGKLVSIVAESEGSLVARVYASAVADPPISRLILLSPLEQPGRVFFPELGHQGYGILGGLGAEMLSALLGGVSPIQLPPQSGFLRSIVDDAGALRDLLYCPVPGEVILEPLADALAEPNSPPASIPTLVLAAYHGGLLTNHEAERDVSRLLAGEQLGRSALLSGLDRTLRLASAAWQVPSLSLSMYSDSANRPSCQAMDEAVRALIWQAPAR
jgi:hypothetical protein